MKKLQSLTILFLFALGVIASATTLQITGTIFQAGTAPDGGYGGGFAGTLNGAVPVTVYCVDVADGFINNTVYNINLTKIPPSSTSFVDNTRSGGFTGTWAYLGSTYTALQRYEMAGWLTTQYAGASTQTAKDALQEAMWTLLDTKLDATGTLTFGGSANQACTTSGTCNTDITNAFAALPSFTLNHVVDIYTDVRSSCTAFGSSGGSPTGASSPGCMQEFVSVDPVPEPNSAALMSIGGALLGLGALRKRKLASK